VIFDVPEWLVALSVVGLGLLMVSPLPYRSGKELDLRHSFGTLVLVVIALLLVIVEHSVTLFAILVAYVLSGPVDWLWRRHTGATLEEVAPAHGHAVGPDARG
jgi:CDP-diacylglycerol--serine O-phosphatidyltransferase